MLPSELNCAVHALAATRLNRRVLQVLDAGSHAWGLDSPKSDWDLRAVTVFPEDVYCSLNMPDDVNVATMTWNYVSTFATDLDALHDAYECVFWDVRKFLKLLAKGNGSAYEWLFSDLVAFGPESTKGAWWGSVRQWARRNFNAFGFCHDRLGVAQNAIKIRWDKPLTPKSVLCAWRPLWQIEWVLAGGTLGFPDLSKLVAAQWNMRITYDADTSLPELKSRPLFKWLVATTMTLINAKRDDQPIPEDLTADRIRKGTLEWIDRIRPMIERVAKPNVDLEGLNRLCLDAIRREN